MTTIQMQDVNKVLSVLRNVGYGVPVNFRKNQGKAVKYLQKNGMVKVQLLNTKRISNSTGRLITKQEYRVTLV